MTRRSYAGGAVKTALTANISSADVACSVGSIDGWPDGSVGPFALVIDRDTAIEEKILASASSAGTIYFITRGYDGTSAQDHSIGAIVEHVYTAVDADEANFHANSTDGIHGLGTGQHFAIVEATQTLVKKTLDFAAGPNANVATNLPKTSMPNFDADAVAANAAAITAAVAAEALARSNADAAHVAAGDPHPQYLTPTEGNAAYDANGAASSAVSAHVSASDPHTQYHNNARGDARYDALGAGSTAASGAVAAHVAAANPHTQYAQGPAASTKIATGFVSGGAGSVAPGDASGPWHVNLTSYGFTSTPRIVTGMTNGVSGVNFLVPRALNATSTGFDLWFYNHGPSTTPPVTAIADWIAIGA